MPATDPALRWVDSHSHLQETYLTGDKRQGRDNPVPDGADPGTTWSTPWPGRPTPGSGASCASAPGRPPRPLALAMAADSADGRFGPDAPVLWASVGLHPHDASEGTAATLALLERAAADPASRLVAVGECGLDLPLRALAADVQRQAFAEQVAAAHRFDLALVIHARDAWDDLFDVLVAEGVPERTVLHCFTGGPDEARRALDAGHAHLVQRDRHLQERPRDPGGRRPVPVSTGSWSRRTARTWPPCRTGADRTSRRMWRWSGAAVAEAQGVAPEEVARASWENTEAVFKLA